MKKTYFFIMNLSLLWAVSCSSGALVTEGTKLPGQTDAQDLQMVQEGIDLFDRGEYQQAVEIYKNALARNPDNVIAMYELALTYTTLKEYQLSYNLCLRIMEYKTEVVRQAVMIAGTDLDELGRPHEAVAYYQAGIKKYPNDLMLHFNLAITQIRLGEKETAKRTLKTALFIRPTHPSSHYVLAGVLYDEGNRIPALLAYTRFLMLEPNSNRSPAAREKVKRLILHGVSEDESKANQINISFNADEPKNEGDFSSVALLLSMKAAHQMSQSKEGLNEKEGFTEIYRSLFSMLGESGVKENKGFIWEFYAPYFAALEKQGFVPLLVDDLFKYQKEDVAPLLKWSEDYKWPSAPK